MNPAAVVPFYFHSNEVRTVVIENEPWFVAKDVCNVLEHSDASMALRGLDDDEKGTRKVWTLGGEQEMNVISESGLYTLIIRSNKPQSKPFRKWVTSEVLPTIRKTGSYTAPKKRTSLWPDSGNALAMAKTREGELMARELTLGVKVARAVGLHGRRQILEHAAALVGERTGSNPLDYFGVKLDEHCPKKTDNNESIKRFVESECSFNREIGDGNRVRIKTVYDRFTAWYGNMVDSRLRGIPSIKAVSKELFRRGADIRKIGGVSYVLYMTFSGRKGLTGGEVKL